MFHFSNSAAPPGETEKALEDPNCTIQTLIKCSNLANAYRTNNPKLMGFLIKPENMRSIFDLLMNTERREDHKSVFALYQTANTQLHRVFADSISLSEYAFKALEDRASNPKASYAAGTMSRILARSYDLWPTDVHEVMRLSKKIYYLIISNIDSLCVYSTIFDFISEKFPIGEFIWNLYRSLSQRTNETAPRICFLAKKIDVPVLDTRTKILNAIEIITAYFKLGLNKLDDFHAKVFDFIADSAEGENKYPEFFKIATTIGQNDRLQKIALTKLIESLTNSNDLAHVNEYAAYLAVCTKKMDQETALRIVASLIDEKTPEFALTSAGTLIENYISNEPESAGTISFKQAIKEIIFFNWNVFHNENQALVSFLIDFSKKIDIESLTAEGQNLPKWFTDDLTEWGKEDFIASNAVDDADFIPFTTNFAFPVEFYNEEKINGLRWGKKLSIPETSLQQLASADIPEAAPVLEDPLVNGEPKTDNQAKEITVGVPQEDTPK